jgi:xanthine dehydrogenase accessory factor
MDSILIQVHHELAQGTDLCLATIVNQIGSAPRALGASFFVRSDGSIAGTIGGGRLEADVIEAAVQTLSSNESRILHFRLKGTEAAQTDMLCGGDVDVYLEPLLAKDKAALEVFAAATQVLAKGQKALMVTPLLPGPQQGLKGRKLLVTSQGDTVGSVKILPNLAAELKSDLDELVSRGRPGLWMQQTPEGLKIDCFLEPIASAPVLYLFGGGHVSLPVASLAKMVGFRVVVIDDRPEFANAQRFPMADEVLVRDFEHVLDDYELGLESYVVIITRGHVFDKDVLAQALRKPTAYLGMIGSRRKRDIIYHTLLDEGFSQDDLAKVHSPVGLDIGAETPEEIAVSIVAELVQERAQRNPVKTGRGPGV